MRQVAHGLAPRARRNRRLANLRVSQWRGGRNLFVFDCDNAIADRVALGIRLDKHFECPLRRALRRSIGARIQQGIRGLQPPARVIERQVFFQQIINQRFDEDRVFADINGRRLRHHRRRFGGILQSRIQRRYQVARHHRNINHALRSSLTSKLVRFRFVRRQNDGDPFLARSHHVNHHRRRD